ncbi:MAG: hypothetical protein R2831_06040 [Chitinophagaceae bacterium]
MKQIYTLLVSILCFISFSSQAQNLVNACESQSACNARPICSSNALVVNEQYVNTYASPASTCVGMVNNWVYFRINCYASGIFNFSLVPQGAGADFDWAFYNITNTGCSNLSTVNQMACNSSGVLGNTGIGGTGTGAFSPSVNLLIGNSYILAISRFNAPNPAGFTLNFTGTTANITDATGPTFGSILPYDTCASFNKIGIKFSEPVSCASVQASDFTIPGAPSFTVSTATSCNGCSAPTPTYAGLNYSNMTDSVTLNFSSTLTAGVYNISAPANAFVDICGNPSAATNISVTVTQSLSSTITKTFDCATQKFSYTICGQNSTSPYQYYAIGPSVVNPGVLGAPTAGCNTFNNIQGGQTYTFHVKSSSGCTVDSVITPPVVIPISLVTAKTNPPCINDWAHDTIKVASLFGGVPPYTYSIAGLGASTAIFFTSPSIGWANLSSVGNYTVTVTDNYNCTKTAVVTLTNPFNSLSISTSNNGQQCFGSCTGQISVSGSLGTQPTSFSISPTTPCSPTQINSGVFNNLSTNITYTITAVDDNGCINTATNIIPSSPAIIISYLSTTHPTSCNNLCIGAATPFATGGIGSKKFYLYNSTQTAFIDSVTSIGGQFQNLCPGTYTLLGKDAAGCTQTSTFTINMPPLPTLALDSTNNVLCNGGCSGKIYTTVTGGSSPFSYTISPNPNAPCGNATLFGTGDYQNLPIGSYKIVVTSNVNQCKDSVLNVNITQPPTPLTFNPAAITALLCNGTCDGAINISASGGTGLISYGITPNATPPCIPAQATSGNFTNLTGGLPYIITATDANACTIATTITISQPAALAVSFNIDSMVSCFGACNGKVTLSHTGGTGVVSYSISPNAGPCGAPLISASGVITNLSANTYTVIGTDQNLCKDTVTFTITQPSTSLSLTINLDNNVSCFGLCDGEANALASGGTPPYQYISILGPGTPQIDPVTGEAEDLCAGNYTITVKDANNCTATSSISITQPNLLTVSHSGLQNVSCNGLCNGSVNANSSGGTGTVIYTITTTNINCIPTQPLSGVFANLGAGSYTITAQDANDCEAIDTFSITEPLPFILNVIDTTSVTCAGSCTGAAVIGFTGGTPAVTYSIVGTGASTCVPVQLTPGNFTGLGADTYTVTGTDGSTCTATTSFTIVEPMPFVLSVDDTTSVLCNGDCNGGALISFIGGNGGVTYTIAGPVGSTCVPTQATPGTFTTLGAGLYTVTGTDDKGCTATVNFTIVQPTVLTTDTISSTSPTCVPGCDGTVTMTSAGGNGNYVYTIAPSTGITVVGNVLSGLCAGTVYTITSTDDKGCTAVKILSLSNPNSPTIATTTLTPPSCGGYCDGSVVLNITGGTTPWCTNDNTINGYTDMDWKRV